MRFNLRQLLVGVAFVALGSAYVGQSIRYRNLATKYDHLEIKYAKAKEAVLGLADITITDQDDGPNKVTVSVEVPTGWPAGLKNDFKDVQPEDNLEFLKSRVSRALH